MERECSKLASHFALEVQQVFEKHMRNSPIVFFFLLLRQIVTKKNGKRRRKWLSEKPPKTTSYVEAKSKVKNALEVKVSFKFY